MVIQGNRLTPRTSQSVVLKALKGCCASGAVIVGFSCLDCGTECRPIIVFVQAISAKTHFFQL